jgi:hypothetical protein
MIVAATKTSIIEKPRCLFFTFIAAPVRATCGSPYLSANP